MIELDYLPITKSRNNADNFIIELDETNYIFEIYWNDLNKYFAFNLYDIDEEPIILGRKITYGVDMLDNIIDDKIPAVEILPVNPAVEDDHITFDNFINSVKCYILPAGGE